MATHLYAAAYIAGLRFASRHGDDTELWAIFERAAGQAVSQHLSTFETLALTADHPALIETFRLHHLTWAE